MYIVHVHVHVYMYVYIRCYNSVLFTHAHVHVHVLTSNVFDDSKIPDDIRYVYNCHNN